METTIEATFEMITPETAKELLSKNTMNRGKQKAVIESYARLMRNGLWKEGTGEPIKIATDGTLLDGQQRLTALIKAGVTLEFCVIKGMDKDVFPVLDTGKIRSPGDTLHISGVQSAQEVAAGIRKFYLLIAGMYSKTGGYSRSITSQEILSLYASNNKFWDAAVTMGKDWYRKCQRILTIGELIGYYAYLHRFDDIKSFEFMDSLSSGANLNSTNPIKLLRDKLVFHKMNKNFSILQSVKTALIIKAWNFYCQGKEIKSLRFNSEKESMPTPISRKK